jgi:hypothetical protein
MAEDAPQGEVISVEPRARAMLLELVSAGGRYIRIHVGRG